MSNPGAGREVLGILEDLTQRYPDLGACRSDIMAAWELLQNSFREGKKLLVCGNGGSSADSSHITGELMKGFRLPRPVPADTAEHFGTQFGALGQELAERLQGALPAISLSSHTDLLTAIANDVGADMVFAQQVYGYGRAGDVLLAISTSGNSGNLMNALMTARALKLRTIGLLGCSGGRMKDLCDVAICVNAEETYLVQERHLPVYHALCSMLETHFFGE